MEQGSGWPPHAWRDAITELGRSGVLAQNHKLLRDLWTTYHLAGPVKKLLDSLLSAEDAMHAKTALNELRDACRSESDWKASVELAGRLKLTETPSWLGRSGLGTVTYNDVLEVINAKRLWQAGRSQLYPWPFNASALKPDYIVGAPAQPAPGQTAEAFYRLTPYVGDNIRASGAKDIAALGVLARDAVISKMRTYSGKKLWVVVDLCDNEVLLHPYSIQEVIAVVDKALDDLQDTTDLEQVTIVLPTHVHTFDFIE